MFNYPGKKIKGLAKVFFWINFAIYTLAFVASIIGVVVMGVQDENVLLIVLGILGAALSYALILFVLWVFYLFIYNTGENTDKASEAAFYAQKILECVYANANNNEVVQQKLAEIATNTRATANYYINTNSPLSDPKPVIKNTCGQVAETQAQNVQTSTIEPQIQEVQAPTIETQAQDIQAPTIEPQAQDIQAPTIESQIQDGQA